MWTRDNDLAREQLAFDITQSMPWLFDMANFLVCIILIIILCKKKLLPLWIGLILSFCSFLPFLLNDFLFPAHYFPDQFGYIAEMANTRALNFFSINDIPREFSKFVWTSYFMSLLPLPYIETISSLAFYNWFLSILLFAWLYNKKFLSGLPLLFLLFYPSLILYTSLSLRDPLIVFFMLVGIVFLIEAKYLKFFIATSPLMILKFQNYFFLLFLLIFFIIFRKENSNNFIKTSIFIIIILCFIPFLNEILAQVNFYRYAFFLEDGRPEELFEPIDGLYNFMIYGITAFPYFLIKPLPWEVANSYQLIQSIENIFVLCFLMVFTKKAYAQSVFITNRWLLYLIFAATVYGLVIYNFGTAVRYKYPIFISYVVGLSYELYKIKGYKFKPFFKIFKKKPIIFQRD